MSHKVAVQCRVPDAAFKESALRRKDGKSVAPVGAVIDASKVPAADLERLIATGAILSESDTAALTKSEQAAAKKKDGR